MKKSLKELYENPSSSAAFSNPSALYKAAKKYGYSFKEVKDFLSKNNTYGVHVKKKRRFPRAKVISYFQNFAWQADLAEIKNFVQNRYYRFILLVVDCFDLMLWARPLKNKKSETVAVAFEDILQESKRTPATLFTDLGTEFTGSPFAKLCSKNGIHQIFLSNTELKAQIAENYVKILMQKITRFTHSKKTKKFVDNLQEIVEGLNNRYIESLGRSPAQVGPENAVETFQRKYSKTLNVVPRRAFKIGDFVRVKLRFDSPFHKRYTQSFSTEIFRVKEIKGRPPTLTYVLEDEDGYEVEGLYYSQDLTEASHE
jgi:hypothetical protein